MVIIVGHCSMDRSQRYIPVNSDFLQGHSIEMVMCNDELHGKSRPRNAGLTEANIGVGDDVFRAEIHAGTTWNPENAVPNQKGHAAGVSLLISRKLKRAIQWLRVED